MTDDRTLPPGREPPAYGPADHTGGGADLHEYLAIARRHWWVIVLSTLVGVAGGWWVVSHQVPSYTATVLLQRESEQSSLQGLGLAGDRSGEDEIASELEILSSRAVLAPIVGSQALQLRVEDPETIRSRVIAEAVVEQQAPPGSYSLAERDGTFVLREEESGRAVSEAEAGQWLEGPGFSFRVTDDASLEEGPVPVRIVRWEEAILRLRGEIRAYQVENTNLIRMRFTSSDPVLAAAVVNEAARSYQAYSAQRAREEARRRREFLGEQLAQVADSLAEKQSSLQQYQERSGVLDPSSEGEALATSLMETETDLRRMRFQEGVLENALRELRSGGGTPETFQRLMALDTDLLPAGQALYTRLRDLEVERNRLTSSRFGYTEGGSRVEVLDSLIASTRSEMRTVTEQSLVLLRDQLRAVEQRAGELRTQVGRLPGQAGVFAQLRQQVDAAQAMYNELSGKYYEAQVAEAVESGNVEVVDPATVPVGPNPMSRTRTLAFALLAGLFFGAGVAVFLDRLDTTVRDRTEAEAVTGLPVLVMVPRMKQKSRDGLPIPFMMDETAAGAEAFRTLRTILRFTQPSQPRALLVTSPTAGAGKSTVSANLALALVQQGSSVLLVDADLRRPTQHQIFGVPREPGLSDVLNEPTVLPRATRSIESFSRLKVVPAGTAVANPSELLGLEVFPRLIQRLIDSAREHFDTVIVDTPPTLPVTDASVIAPLVDRVVMVAVPGQTDRRALRQATEQLGRLGAPLLGVVLNKVTPGGGRYYYSGDYYTQDAPESKGRKLLKAAGKPRAALMLLTLVTAVAVIGALWGAPLAIGNDDPEPAPLAARTPVADSPAAPVDTAPATEPEVERATEEPAGSAPGPVDSPLPYSVVIEVHRDLSLAWSRASQLEGRESGATFYVAPKRMYGALYYPVLAGPLATQATGEALARRLVADGDPSVGADWAVQSTPLAFNLGDYGTRGEAVGQGRQLIDLGVPTYVVEVPFTSGPARYRLYAGAYADASEATAMKGLLDDAGVAGYTLERRVGRVPTPQSRRTGS